MLVENNLAALWRQLDKAEQKLAEANKELRNAERKADRASAVVSNLREEVALEKLRMWGDKPDLAELMASGKNSTMVFYKAMEAVAASRGFYIGGMWADTKQTVLRFGLNRSEIGGIERRRPSGGGGRDHERGKEGRCEGHPHRGAGQRGRRRRVR